MGANFSKHHEKLVFGYANGNSADKNNSMSQNSSAISPTKETEHSDENRIGTDYQINESENYIEVFTLSDTDNNDLDLKHIEKESLRSPIEIDRKVLKQLGLFDDDNNSQQTMAMVQVKNVHYQKKPTELKPFLFKQLSGMPHVSLCSRNLVKLSPNLGLLDNMVTLQLCCNELTELPKEIGYLRNLTSLILSQNKLKSIPETIGFLTKLIELKLNSNKLRQLPKSIIALSKLQILFLDRNEYEELPYEIVQLKGLVVLELSHNPIQFIPAQLLRIESLRRIGLESCPLITTLPQPSMMGIAGESIPRLKELAARTIVQYNLNVFEGMQYNIKQYLCSVSECAFCGGPLFDYSVLRWRWILKNDFRIPVFYKMCSNHWNTDEERIAAMFCQAPTTAPKFVALSSGQLSRSHSTVNLFNSYAELDEENIINHTIMNNRMLYPPKENKHSKLSKAASSPNLVSLQDNNQQYIKKSSIQNLIGRIFKSSEKKTKNNGNPANSSSKANELQDNRPQLKEITLKQLSTSPSLPILSVHSKTTAELQQLEEKKSSQLNSSKKDVKANLILLERSVSRLELQTLEELQHPQTISTAKRSFTQQ